MTDFAITLILPSGLVLHNSTSEQLAYLGENKIGWVEDIIKLGVVDITRV